MRKLLFVIILLSPITVISQNWEYGLMFGATNYNGDLSYQVYVRETHPAAGALIKLNASKYISFRAHLLYGSLSGADSNGLASKEGAYTRNLSFKTSILELGLQLEFHFSRIFASKFKKSSKTSLYAFGGIAGFRFNPKTLYQDQWVELQPLGTEGQGTLYGLEDKYSLYEISLPFGIAFRTAINNNWNITFEMGSRMTFTEHLDDVGGYYINYDYLAQTNGGLAAELADRTPNHVRSSGENVRGGKRGNPEINDWYYFTGFTLTRHIQCRDHCFKF